MTKFFRVSRKGWVLVFVLLIVLPTIAGAQREIPITTKSAAGYFQSPQNTKTDIAELTQQNQRYRVLMSELASTINAKVEYEVAQEQGSVTTLKPSINALVKTIATARQELTMSLSIRQVIFPPEKAAAHPVTNFVISPVAQGSMFSEFPLETTIHEFLFEVTKDGSVFWVGAAVPVGTIDFTRTQVFFHPTVVQRRHTIAEDTDYREFKGGWSARMQRYVEIEGGQLAGARLMPLLVPFTTMSALSRRGNNMFSDRPVETLNAIMAAIQSEIFPEQVLESPSLTQVGVSSFSSGISAMRLFLKDMSSSGLVKEVIDFDSPFIVAEPKRLTRSPGAVSKCYTQHHLAQPEVGYVYLPTRNFAGISKFQDPRSDFHAHACIGFMMYWSAMMTSVIL